MTTATLYSERKHFWSMYRLTLRRNLGYGGLFAILLAIFYPVQYAMEVFRVPSIQEAAHHTREAMQYFSVYGAGKNYTVTACILSTMLLLLAPLVLALIFNKYMHSKTAVDVYHALPIRRGTMLLANTAAAMTLIAAPLFLCTLSVSVMSILRFGFSADIFLAQLIDSIGWMICIFVVYAAVTFVSTLVGNVFDTLIFSGVLLAALPTVCLLFLMLNEMFLYGYHAEYGWLELIMHLTPAFVMPYRIATNDMGGMFYPDISNIALIVYLLIGILILYVAVRLYTRRKSECAQMNATRGVLPMIEKFLATFVMGIFIGRLFYWGNDRSIFQFLLWTAIGGGITYGLLEVVLARGFKTIKKSLPVGAIMVAGTVLLCLPSMTGGMGYETSLPSSDDIAYVDIESADRFGIDGNTEYLIYNEAIDGYGYRIGARIEQGSEALPAVLQLHQSIIEKKDVENVSDNPIYLWVRLEYHMKDGSTVKRRYQEVDNQVIEQLYALETTADYVRQRSPAFYGESEQIKEWSIQNNFSGQRDILHLKQDQSKQLLEAVRADILSQTPEQISQTQTAGWTLSLTGANTDIRIQEPYRGRFVLTPDMARTRAFLSGLGYDMETAQRLDECTSVFISKPDVYSYGYYYSLSSGTTTKTIHPHHIEGFNLDNYIDGFDEEENVYMMEGNTFIEITDPEQIKRLAQGTLGSWRFDEPVCQVIFRFEDGLNATWTLVAAKDLPQDLLNTLMGA